jgi:hypothetical protein
VQFRVIHLLILLTLTAILVSYPAQTLRVEAVCVVAVVALLVWWEKRKLR